MLVSKNVRPRVSTNPGDKCYLASPRISKTIPPIIHSRSFSWSIPCLSPLNDRRRRREQILDERDKKLMEEREPPVRGYEEEKEEDFEDAISNPDEDEDEFLYDEEEEENEEEEDEDYDEEEDMDEEEKKYQPELKRDLRKLHQEVAMVKGFGKGEAYKANDIEGNRAEVFKEKLKKDLQDDKKKQQRKEEQEKKRKEFQARRTGLRARRIKKMKDTLEYYTKGHQTVPARELIKVFRKLAMLRMRKEEEEPFLNTMVSMAPLVTSDNVKEFTGLILAFGRRSKPDAALAVFQRMKTTEAERKAQRMQKILTREEKGAYHFHLDVFAFNAIMNACTQNGRIAEAFGIFDDLMHRWSEEQQKHSKKNNKGSYYY